MKFSLRGYTTALLADVVGDPLGAQIAEDVNAVAHLVCWVDGFGLLRFGSAHLAPSSPQQRVIEAESLALLAEKDELGPLIIGGDWNAYPLNAPDPGVTGAHPGKLRHRCLNCLRDHKARSRARGWRRGGRFRFTLHRRSPATLADSHGLSSH